jgi:hypothetical protein
MRIDCDVRFMGSESDPEKGWWKMKEWRGDARYAAMVAKATVLHFLLISELEGSESRFKYFQSNDNAFLNDFGAPFSQRTLLARQVNC